MVIREPWKVAGVPWKTEAAFWAWVRGVLRKGWSRHPVKIEYIKTYRKRIINPKVASRKRFPEVWGMTCEICGIDHVQTDIEIDHEGDNSQFRGLSDAESFMAHLFLVDFDCLRALCKKCHKIVSHSQNTGLSFEEAAQAKAVIEIMKRPVAEILAICKEHGYTDVSNAAKRKLAIQSILKEKLL